MTGPKIPGKAKKNLQDKALAMRIINPDMKIILITCDPIRQFYSQIKMQERRRLDWTEKNRDISKCKACLGDIDTDIDTAFNRWLRNIEKTQKLPSWVDRFMETFMMYFPPDQVHIIDGENMAHNAQKWTYFWILLASPIQNSLLKMMKIKDFHA